MCVNSEPEHYLMLRSNELKIKEDYIKFLKMPEQKIEEKPKKSDAPACCIGCVRWEKFGKNCFYYWEGKKHCTMWAGSWEEVPLG